MTGVTPTDEQAAAIKAIVEWYRSPRQEFYLAGYAGVGKSTVAAMAIEELKGRCRVDAVRTAAYTGKAASVLRRKGIHDAQTIHSLIYLADEDEVTGELRFVLSEDSPAATADLIVLDECSMVGTELADDLRSFGKKILVMGDPGQLPPISGEGAFTSRDPDVFLREIHRQAAESPIIELATLARQGKPLPKGYARRDVRVLPLTKETQQEVYREDTQPVCGLNRVRWTYNLRIRMRRGFDGVAPQPGERILCCRNNREEGIYNGQAGVLRAATPAAKWKRFGDVWELSADMEDSGRVEKLAVDPYLFKRHFDPQGHAERLRLPRGLPRLDEFDFGYVLTAHQGAGQLVGRRHRGGRQPVLPREPGELAVHLDHPRRAGADRPAAGLSRLRPPRRTGRSRPRRSATPAPRPGGGSRTSRAGGGSA